MIALLPCAIAFPLAIMVEVLRLEKTVIQRFGLAEKFSDSVIQFRVTILDEVADPCKAEILIFERDKVLSFFGCQPPRGENLSMQGLPPAILREFLA